MKIEKEQKFKLNFLPDFLKNEKPIRIDQGYLIFDNFKQVRIRIVDGLKAYLCYKSKISDNNNVERYEYEYEIPIIDGLELLSSTNIKVKKFRYSFDLNETGHVDIDLYEDGLEIVEIEYLNELKTPIFCGENISNDKEYSNLNIALKNIKR